MEMEVDEGSACLPTDNNEYLFVCCITKKHGLKKSRVPVTSFSELKLECLREAVIEELNSWEWVDENDKPQNIDILHTSRLLKTDEDVKRVGPLSVITVIKKDCMNNPSTEEDHNSPKFIADYITKHKINDQLMSCSLALRTAFLHPKFVTMIENLGDSEVLENIFAMVPVLKNDPVGIGLLQDPTLIFHLSDPEALKKVANVKPWIIDAFNFLTASIHQEKGGPPQGIPSNLFNASMFEGDDESMEDDEDEGSPGGSRGGGARITREQLTAALGALTGGVGAAGASGNAFGGLFQAPTTARPTARPAAAPASNPVAAAGANIQNLMNTLSGAGGGIPGQPLSGQAVARAVTDALRRLTPEQRADQLNAIRNFATQLQQQQPPSTPAAPPAHPPRTVPTPQAAPTAQQPDGSNLAQQYQSQLRQMREMGIMDERLSVLALRLSEGDVNTAVELIFSGWTGEGSDPVD